MSPPNWEPLEFLRYLVPFKRYKYRAPTLRHCTQCTVYCISIFDEKMTSKHLCTTSCRFSKFENKMILFFAETQKSSFMKSWQHSIQKTIVQHNCSTSLRNNVSFMTRRQERLNGTVWREVWFCSRTWSHVPITRQTFTVIFFTVFAILALLLQSDHMNTL